MNDLKRFAVISIFLLLLASGTALAGEPGPGIDSGKLHQEAMQLLTAKKYEDAVRKYAVLLRENPNDTIALYNVACACSLMGKKDRAVAFLERAVEEGFLDFDHIRKDSDLDPIRDLDGYKRIVENREEYVRRAGRTREEKYRKKLGDRYTYTRDEKINILFITNVDARSRDNLLNALRRYADAHWRDFFKFKPQYPITVLVPKNTDDYKKDFGGRKGAAGFYNQGNRTLTVNLATGGGTMIHEWTHALHYGDMEGLKQKHPIWIVEGFGTLYEQCTIRSDGTAVGLTNWRLPGLQRALRDRPELYIPWKKLMDPKSSVFRKSRESIAMAYAVTRYIFYYMQEKKVLRKFYGLYRKGYAEDPTGARFVEEVFGKKIEEIEAEWKPWVLKLRYSRSPGPRAMPKVRLGVYTETAEDGVGISDVVEGSCAEKTRILAGDVIVAMDGRKVKVTNDLMAFLMKKKPGDRIKVTVRRGDGEVELEVTLDPR